MMFFSDRLAPQDSLAESAWHQETVMDYLFLVIMFFIFVKIFIIQTQSNSAELSAKQARPILKNCLNLVVGKIFQF